MLNLERASIDNHSQHSFAFDHFGLALGAYGNDGENEIISHPSDTAFLRA